MITPLAMAQDTSYEGLRVADLLAIPQGRMTSVTDNVAVSIWYNGTTAATLGVSHTTSDIYLYEDGGTVTTLNGLAASQYIDISQTSGNTAGEIATIINSDTNGAWHAFVGPDATDGTVITGKQLNARIATVAVNRNETDPTELTFDTATVDRMSCGIRGDTGDANRLRSFEVSPFGDTAGGVEIEVWNDSEMIYTTNGELPTDNTTTTLPVGEISPTSVEFDAPGLGADFGDGICVFVTPYEGNITSAVDYEITGNISIIYSVFETQ